ncbi:uncharacterized protein LOC108910407 [Anoplophora glabripennis]|uniref:uncharacterized protein LOC108910407 n=1 Tax=Anoplophora glabripennis TaxID=217634 RepID=UPI000874A2A7|nr:uncharacterized protein LOC108910407 [Anoplophora glabripennis]
MQKPRLMTMFPKGIFLILGVVSYGLFNQAYGYVEECGENLDLSLSYEFNFTGRDIFLQWVLKSQITCHVLYHLVIRDDDLGVILNEYLKGTSSLLEVSPCILYYIELNAINEEIPNMEGPAVTMGIVFSKRVQIAPSLGLIDIRATSINMTWTLEGGANRCPLIRLYVDGGSYFNQTVSLQDLSDNSQVSVEITPLKPNSMYFFRVYVENNAGFSPATQLAVQTLEATDELD